MSEAQNPYSIEAITALVRAVVPDVSDDASQELLESGIVDSYSLIEIVASLEELTGKEFGPEEMRAENFRSLQDIAKLLQSL